MTVVAVQIHVFLFITSVLGLSPDTLYPWFRGDKPICQATKLELDVPISTGDKK